MFVLYANMYVTSRPCLQLQSLAVLQLLHESCCLLLSELAVFHAHLPQGVLDIYRHSLSIPTVYSTCSTHTT